MEAFLAGLGVSLATVFVAELGDKTQLLTLALATRFRPALLLAGLSVTIALLTGLAVGVGAVLKVSLPERPITIVAGLLFIGFGLWTLRPEGVGDDEDDVDEAAAGAASGRSEMGQLAAAMTAFFLAELGDKTQLASLTLATTYAPLGVWVGATLGMIGANALAIVVGRVLGARLPERPIRIGAAVLFLVFGVVLLWQGVRG